jgi:hypothetical protein
MSERNAALRRQDGRLAKFVRRPPAFRRLKESLQKTAHAG